MNLLGPKDFVILSFPLYRKILPWKTLIGLNLHDLWLCNFGTADMQRENTLKHICVHERRYLSFHLPSIVCVLNFNHHIKYSPSIHVCVPNRTNKELHTAVLWKDERRKSEQGVGEDCNWD